MESIIIMKFFPVFEFHYIQFSVLFTIWLLNTHALKIFNRYIINDERIVVSQNYIRHNTVFIQKLLFILTVYKFSF